MSSFINSYNRPNFPYRCGRASLWGKPCALGANADGTCGGTSACVPRKKVAIGFYAQDGRNMVVPVMLARYQMDHAVKHKWHVNHAERCGQHVTA